MVNMNDPRQNALFDPYELMLAPMVLKRLKEGWQGLMRFILLELMPVEVLANEHHETMGCPTKELYSVAGLLFIMEFKNWTREQAVEQYCLNIGVQYALNLPPGGGVMCVKTLDRYRKIFREERLGAEVYERITRTLVGHLELKLDEQRGDSTHIFSDMALFGRTQLMGVAVKRFLAQVRRHAPQAYEALDEDLRKRYAPSANQLFADTARDKESRRLLRQQVAEDMYALMARFEADDRHNERSTYKAMVWIFHEQCEVDEAKVSIKDKAGGRVIQNPSDPGATFDGKKGSGYQAQVVETCSEENDVQLITAAVPQTAADSDAESFPLILGQLTEGDRKPHSLLLDHAYGSDRNVQAGQVQGVEVVSPVNRSRRNPDNLHVEDFTIDPETEEVQACPAGHAPRYSKHDVATGVTTTQMNPGHCQHCPHRAQCPVKGTRKRTFTHTPAERRRAERLLAEQEPAWRKRYAKRAGIEGLMSRLKRCTGLGRLRVRGQPAVFNAIFLKLAGWNIYQAAKAPAMREIIEKRAREAYNKLQRLHNSLKIALRALIRTYLLPTGPFGARRLCESAHPAMTFVPPVFEGGGPAPRGVGGCSFPSMHFISSRERSDRSNLGVEGWRRLVRYACNDGR